MHTKGGTMSNPTISHQLVTVKSLSPENLAQKTHSQAERLAYKSPVLKEHGNVKDVTLQTFFGTFSPPPGP
jgi:hypothetical protein